MPSFCSETTVEIAVASQLRTLFGADRRRVVPVHFWASREGSRAASKLHAGIAFRLVALFVRRPKLGSVPTVVAGKLNHELVQFAKVARSMNILTFAVFPCVGNLLDLAEDPKLLFLDVPETDGDVHFAVRLDRDPCAVTPEVAPLLREPGAIVRRLHQVQAPATLEDWSRTIKHVRREVPGPGSWLPWGGSTYKPLYLFLAETEDR